MKIVNNPVSIKVYQTVIKVCKHFLTGLPKVNFLIDGVFNNTLFAVLPNYLSLGQLLLVTLHCEQYLRISIIVAIIGETTVLQSYDPII